MPDVLVSTVHPLGGNYGGVLQAFALQRAIEQHGVKVATIHGQPARAPLVRRAGSRGKRLLLQGLLRRNMPVNPQPGDLLRQRTNTLRFVERYIPTVDYFGLEHNHAERLLERLRVIVVGSDQVWRHKYSNVQEQLLSFAAGYEMRRISYAASFGVGDIAHEYPPALLRKSRDLAREFDALSVREEQGRDIVRRYWGREALRHVDPTLLLDADVYVKLLDDPVMPLKEVPGGLFRYVLDRTPEALTISERIARALDMPSFELLPPTPTRYRDLRVASESYRLPPVEQWLKSIRDSEFVVTDSFHGTVFAILFRKPFACVGNVARGLARFTSLLEVLGLQERLVTSDAAVTLSLLTTPDWGAVSDVLARERRRSYDYLEEHLRTG